jgi:hypothetical protein
MNSHQFGNTTTRRTKSLALIRCIDHQRKLRKYLFMAGIKRRSFDRKPICETFSRELYNAMILPLITAPQYGIAVAKQTATS